MSGLEWSRAIDTIELRHMIVAICLFWLNGRVICRYVNLFVEQDGQIPPWQHNRVSASCRSLDYRRDQLLLPEARALTWSANEPLCGSGWPELVLAFFHARMQANFVLARFGECFKLYAGSAHHYQPWQAASTSLMHQIPHTCLSRSFKSTRCKVLWGVSSQHVSRCQ